MPNLLACSKFIISFRKLNIIPKDNEKRRPQQAMYLKGINFSLEINFTNFASFGRYGKNWFLLKSLVTCQFSKFEKFISSKNFRFLNSANQVSGQSRKRLFVISYKKLLQQVKHLSCDIR